MKPIIVIGAGLAGCEATWQIAKRGGSVILYEMKPDKYSPAHRSPYFSELVCSNSFKSESMDNASGILKEELERLDSLILKIAKSTRVPAGNSLAVDRDLFSKEITKIIENLEKVKIIRKEMTIVQLDEITVIATGPLTSESLSEDIQRLTGKGHLFFYDAISPIVTVESINLNKAFMASRYGKGGDDYINCPMNEEEYNRFVEALNRAEKVPLRPFEEEYFFEGCLPIEELAKRGKNTLAYGPLKPVGLVDPRTGKQPFAVVQLRQEDKFGRLYNLVGFQTRLKYEEQKKIFRMIPGLENAEFVRLGSIHRNTFIDSPRLLNESLQLKSMPNIFFAGQITGVEGYMESTAMGLVAGINAYRFNMELPVITPPPTTAIGTLIQYITHCKTIPFQPMNINFGLFPPIKDKIKGKGKKFLLAERAIRDIEEWKVIYNLGNN